MTKKILKYLFRVAVILFILLNIIAAFHAYKFTHFYETGDIPVNRSGDMTAWEKTKFILLGTDRAKSINKSTPNASYQTVKFLTIDSLWLEAWDCKPDTAVAKGTVIMFHGHGGCKSGVLEEGYSFLNMGYNILMVDFRAHGGSDGNTCTIGMNESKDVLAAYGYAVAKGEKNIILWGTSLGAASIVHAIDEFELEPAKVILEMPFGSLLDAVKGRVRMMNLPVQPTSTLLTFWGGIEQKFWAFNLRPSEYVKEIKCPVLLQWGKNDPRVLKEETDLIYKNIPTAKKLVVYEYSGHQSLCNNEHKKWMYEVKKFLEQ